MGNCLASFLAITYKGPLERVIRLLIRGRDTDAILIIVKSHGATEEVFRNLHRDDIWLSRCALDEDGWLSFLNIAIKIRDEGFETKLF